MYVCVSVYVCLYVCMYICMLCMLYVCIYVCKYVYMYCSVCVLDRDRGKQGQTDRQRHREHVVVGCGSLAHAIS